ncbi:MAG: ABC transporter ATP-binding protein [Wenzhouxiangellaceae bacterium]|nr:ABC transporter ATP-binding protein [Wenzhouxiangellaceae bacterium]
MTAPLLSVRNLTVDYVSAEGPLRVVEDATFRMEAGETLGIVGESGCGKSTLALALLGLLPASGARRVSGSIRLDGTDLATLDERRMRGLRGNALSMIFQEPMTALNPVLRVGRQVADVLVRHERISRRAAHRATVELLAQVGLPEPERRVRAFPHELSGGQRQRVMIAMALACRPRLLVADEPTTALDVTTQAQVLARMRDLRERFGTAVLLVTHDLGIVAETCDRALVMYAGRIVEQAPVAELFRAPRHRYTEAMLAAMPRLEAPADRLPTIPGRVPAPGERPSGCRFADRCAHATDACRESEPRLRRMGRSTAACIHPVPQP